MLLAIITIIIIFINTTITPILTFTIFIIILLTYVYIYRLYDVVHRDHELNLIFEYLDQDLKKYIDTKPDGLDPLVTKYLLFQLLTGTYDHHGYYYHCG